MKLVSYMGLGLKPELRRSIAVLHDVPLYSGFVIRFCISQDSPGTQIQ